MTGNANTLRRTLLALPVLLPVGILALAQPAERVVRITTHKFESNIILHSIRRSPDVAASKL